MARKKTPEELRLERERKSKGFGGTSMIDGFVDDARRNNPTTILPQPQVSTAQRPLNSITNDARLQQTISNAKFDSQARALRGMTSPPSGMPGVVGVGIGTGGGGANNQLALRNQIGNPNTTADDWFNQGTYTTPDDPWSWGDSMRGAGGITGAALSAKAMHEAYSGNKRRGENKLLADAAARGELRTASGKPTNSMAKRGWFNPMRYTGRGKGTKPTGAPQYYNSQGVRLSTEDALEIARQGKVNMKAERGPNILQRATSKAGDFVKGKKAPPPAKDLLLTPDSPIEGMSMKQKNEFIKLNGGKTVRTHADADMALNKLGYDTGGISPAAVEAPTPEAVEAKPEAKTKGLGQSGEAVLDSRMKDLSRANPDMSPEDLAVRKNQMRDAILEQSRINPEQTKRFMELEALELNPGRMTESITTNQDGSPKLKPDGTPYTREEKVRIAEQIQNRNNILKEMNAGDISTADAARREAEMAETRRIVEEATLRPSENISDSTIKPGEPDWKMGERGRILYNSDMGYVEFKDLSLADMNEMNTKRFGGKRPKGKGTDTPRSRSYNDATRKWVTMNRTFDQVDLKEQNRRLKNLGAKRFDYTRPQDAVKAFKKIELELKTQQVNEARAREARMAKNKGGGSIRMGSVLGGVDPSQIKAQARAELAAAKRMGPVKGAGAAAAVAALPETLPAAWEGAKGIFESRPEWMGGRGAGDLMQPFSGQGLNENTLPAYARAGYDVGAGAANVGKGFTDFVGNLLPWRPGGGGIGGTGFDPTLGSRHIANVLAGPTIRAFGGDTSALEGAIDYGSGTGSRNITGDWEVPTNPDDAQRFFDAMMNFRPPTPSGGYAPPMAR